MAEKRYRSLRKLFDKVSILTSVISKFRKISTVRRKRSSSTSVGKKLSLYPSFKDTFSCLGDLLLVTFIRCVTSIYVHDIDIYIYMYIYVYNMCRDSVIFSVDKFDKFSCYSIDRCNGESRLFSRCEPRG